MNSERQQAYLNLISQLLNCDSGDEAEILKTHPELLDDGLVVAMLEEADNLREQGKLNNANWLKNFAGLLGKVDGDFLAGIALKAEADRLLEQGDRQYDISQFREALQFDEQALTIYREIRDRQGEAYCLNNLGLVYYSLGQYDKAIEFHQQYLEISREIEYRQGEANSLNSLGLAYKSLGQFHRAIEFHQQSLEISREIGYRQGEAYCLNNLGLVYYSLWQFQRAIEFHQQSLEIKREIGNHQGEAASLSSLGNAYDSLGQFERAIEFHQQSLEIEREIEYRQGEADSLGNLGNAYQALGQFQQAIEFHQQSLEIEREIEYRQGEAASLGNLGLAYDSLGQFERAIEFHQQSLEIEREIEYRQGEAASLGNLGNAYQSLGQFERAIEFHQQSLEIKREIGNRQGEANALGNLGNAYQSLGQSQRAIEFHQQSLEIEREIEDRVGESISLNNLGYTFLKINQLVEAETALCASIAIHETLRSELVNNDHKASIFETQISPYLNLQKVLVAQSKFDEALEISEMSRTRAFVELLQQTLLTNELPANNETNKLSIPKIQQIAKYKNSTIVEYSIVKLDIYIWVIQPNGNITHRAANLEPLNQQNQTLKQIILKTRVSIGTDETDDAGNKIQLESQYNRDETGGFPLLQLLHQILIEPIIDLLPTDANSPIIFVPHYDLFLVPFAALQDSHNRYLIENHTILTSPSIQVLELTREHQNRVRGLRQAALIVGDPTIAAKFNENPYKLRQIPRAKEAAEAIAATLGTEAISGDNATKVAILDRMLNTRIVHLSAHGLLDDFQSSGIPGAIILAPSGDDDGAIHAVDILQLKLDSELVVLSACSTGRGKITGDGVIGLSRCFILAGVPSIIVSLWNMGVISAKLLMTEFYQNLARGDNRAAALRCAMLTTKARFPSPIAWAAFTLIGETETLPLSTEKTDLRRLVMSLPDDAKPEEIVAAFSKLLKISEPQFVAELSAIDVGAMDNVSVIAERIKDWCETKPQIEENLENEIYQMGAGGTDSDAPEEVVREFYETLKENKIRLGLSRNSVAVENPAPAVGEQGPGGG
ncbi:MAG: CHAT domain-containing protein [Microcoleus sp. PH2017_39_LGB_O_B]|uniref:CHAT domain-containing tetratricopeptide repeat protein n=1 Tax=unclassified Microcoleus TaxID=2642155 RepID=UPI001D7CA9A8|nr:MULTISPECIES: CHAT domain-containing tetratricopeptide repeat protein [unclassified Microcoleus]MCC3449999.1 CHAT domain-containing protein [Microcoleus sp. PH2017_09_SFU_O_A]MCC3630942.1 CHAT domain-containing protein [Microcoleus sp. PH2017_39_LGB_O_B]MCC3643184.1 CHAT domain-containing protein [Microcoleus sp. PH2017_33_LGB_O_A]